MFAYFNHLCLNTVDIYKFGLFPTNHLLHVRHNTKSKSQDVLCLTLITKNIRLYCE